MERNERSVFALIDGHRMHVYETGVESETTLVFLSGSGTVSPVHDFKVLYEKLSGKSQYLSSISNMNPEKDMNIVDTDDHGPGIASAGPVVLSNT